MSAEIKPISGAEERVRLADAVPLTTPFTMNIFPTNACNFRCNYCAQSLGTKMLQKKYHFTYETMSMRIFTKAVEQMKHFPEKFKLVSFMGHGEPLLHKDLPEMVRMMRTAGVTERIEIITNGSCLTHDLSEKLVAAGVSGLRISLQGLSSKKYQEISGVHIDFDAFIEELKYFYAIRGESKLFVKIVDTSLENNEEHFFYELFSSFTDRMYVEHIKPVYDGVDYDELPDDVKFDRYGNFHEKRMVCPLPFYMLALWPNGDVVPCDAIYKPVALGNVEEDTLAEIWNGKCLKQFWRIQLEKKRLEYPGCSVCCAPDDVSHPLDVIDTASNEVMERIDF